MTDTILFDLDGTLLHFSQEAFIGAYFAELEKVFKRLGFDAKTSVGAVWAGTKAMMQNDGRAANTQRFWRTFADRMDIADEKLGIVEAACDSFYMNEFNSVKSVMIPNDVSKRLVRNLKAKGYGTVLATNPLFPACAVETRLQWIGLEPDDFLLVTHYSNSSYCKPNPEYFREILTKIRKTPENCIMAGNSPAEDMSAGALGIETFLVTDCLENESGTDITAFRRGSLAELETYLMSLPDIIK
ncbi:MAG: HAD family hydrolase [Oscillospiraceae bacterium]|nr:HAD family hydrolase [Oscillospiraceae bacterium]